MAQKGKKYIILTPAVQKAGTVKDKFKAGDTADENEIVDFESKLKGGHIKLNSNNGK